MPTKTQSVVDDAAYAAAKEKLAELEAKYFAADAEYSAAVEAGRQFDPIETAATALLSDAPAAEVADLTALKRQVQILHRAVEMQNRVVDEARQSAFSPICASALPGHRRVLGDYVQAGEKFFAAADAVTAYLSELQTRGDGAALCGGISLFGVDPFILNQMRHALKQLASVSVEYRRGA